MTEEEQKAIEIVNSLKEWGKIHFIVKDRSYARLNYDEVYLILNLIYNLQKENEELKETLKCTQDSWFNDTQKLDKQQKELDLKDKVIDEVTKEIEILRQYFDESSQPDFIRILEILRK